MTLSKFALATLVPVLVAQAASAQVANGRFQYGACTTHPQETIVRLQNNVLTYWESQCTLSNPVPIQGTDGYSYVGNCAGEGTQWTANMMLIPLHNDTVMRVINDGQITDYTRCSSS